MVIDGHTGFTGGINLADEYINRIERFGHWKDDGIMLKGDAVWNLTEMFLSTWNALRRTDWDFSPYFPDRYIDEISVMPQGDGYICPYGDTPLDDEPTSENGKPCEYGICDECPNTLGDSGSDKDDE